VWAVNRLAFLLLAFLDARGVANPIFLWQAKPEKKRSLGRRHGIAIPAVRRVLNTIKNCVRRFIMGRLRGSDRTGLNSAILHKRWNREAIPRTRIASVSARAGPGLRRKEYATVAAASRPTRAFGHANNIVTNGQILELPSTIRQRTPSANAKASADVRGIDANEILKAAVSFVMIQLPLGLNHKSPVMAGLNVIDCRREDPEIVARID